jgi:hypothetical protein
MQKNDDITIVDLCLSIQIISFESLMNKRLLSKRFKATTFSCNERTLLLCDVRQSLNQREKRR